MSKRILFLLAAAVVFTASLAVAQRLDPTSGSLIRAEMVSGWSLGVRLQADHRQFVSDALPDRIDVDLRRLVLRAGVNPLAWAHVYGELGSATADMDTEDGEAGLCWAGGLRLRLVEQVYEASPVYGDLSSIDITVDGQYRSTESNFDRDFNWQEWMVSPTLGFTMANKQGNWRLYQPTALSLRAGIVFLDGDGDYGAADIETNRDFGGVVGLDALWRSGWTVNFRALLLSGEERELSVGVARNF